MNTQTPKKEIHHSHRDSLLKWGILFVLLLAFLLLFVFPETQEWNTKRKEYNRSLVLIEDLQMLESETRDLLDQKEKELQQFQQEKQLEELQTFPTSIDYSKIAQILEVYTLQLKNLVRSDYTPYFELKNIDFGRTQKTDESLYDETETTISFEADQESFEDFILFLQSGNPTPRFLSGIEMVPSQIDANSYQFLTTYKLPVLHITSIAYQPRRQNETGSSRDRRGVAQSTLDERSDVLSVTLKTVLFSHPTE